MSKVTNLNQYKQSKQLQHLREQVEELTSMALIEFEGFCQSSNFDGNWNDHYWRHQNRAIWFSELRDIHGQIVTSKTPSVIRTPITGIWANLVRLYAFSRIKRGTSAKSVSANVIAVTYFLDALQYDERQLTKLRQPLVAKSHELMLSESLTPSTAFEKYKIIIAFVREVLVNNKLCPSFKPSVDVANPRLAQTDTTKKEYVERRAKKYEEDIDRYLALAKRRWDVDQMRIKSGEMPIYPRTKPIYDELRFLTIPFLMAFGLRVGELCRLTDDCLQYDEVNQRWYLNVYTEKGQLPSARPLPRVWEKVVRDAYARILELTKPSRDLAVDIESTGAAAFKKLLAFPDRSHDTLISFLDNGLDPDLYFYRSEIGADSMHSSGLSYSSLRKGQAYATAQVGEAVMAKTSQKRQKQIVISKIEVAQIAYQEYKRYQSEVFQENLIEDGEQGGYSSNSFSVDIPFSKHLFLAYEHSFTLAHKQQGFIPKPMSARHMHRWLANDGSRSSSLFKRFDIRDSEGDIVDIGTHQFRHWLTTAIMRSGKNEMMIDLFMGRAPGQTRHYDHRTAKERAEGLRKRYLSTNLPDDALGRRVKRMRNNEVSADIIESAVIQTLQVAHFTPWGVCWRDLDVNPCEKGMMCLRGEGGKGCNHFGIDPTDEQARQSIHNTKIHYESQLSVLLPNHEELRRELNRQEPLDQHIQFCIDTLEGCESALRAYENYTANQDADTSIVKIFPPEDLS